MIRNITQRLRPQSSAVLSRWASLIGITAIGAVISLGLAGCPPADTFKDVLQFISVGSVPNKVEYIKGDTFSTEGLKIFAAYKSDAGAYSSEEVTGFTTDPANGAKLNEAGEKTVTVSYSEDDKTVTTTFRITVRSPSN